MRYFGSKQVAEIDEDAIAVERLMALANRFKAANSDVVVEGSEDGKEAPEAPEQPN